MIRRSAANHQAVYRNEAPIAWPLKLAASSPPLAKSGLDPTMESPMTDLRRQFPIQHGRHPSPEDGLCAMEMVAWLAGEEHSDEPDCACPILTSLVRASNDLLPSDEARDRYLRPLIPRLVNTRSSAYVENQRAFLAVDCTVRFFAPIQLSRLGHHKDAETLRSIGPIRHEGDAALAATCLSSIAPELRAALWTTRMALRSRSPRIWVTGAAHAAKSAESWQAVRRLLEDMIAIDATQTPHRSS